MSFLTRTRRIEGTPRVVAIALIGCFLGAFVAGEWNPLPLGPREEMAPMPYRVAKIPGGTVLRMAMVHDVIHERYLRHGAAWYTQRIVDAQQIADQPALKGTPTWFDALDDLAVSYERTGKYDLALMALDRKREAMSLPVPQPATQETPASSTEVREQEELNRIIAAQNLTEEQHQQYKLWANMGTVMVHSAMHDAIVGKPDALDRVRVGLACIDRAIEINPGAHFGREKWQAIAIRSMLSNIEHPDLLARFDLFGDEFDGPLDNIGNLGPLVFLTRITYPMEPISPAGRLRFRNFISRLHSGNEWQNVTHIDVGDGAPFDEPTLGIIGMWTMGGGPNPHFALALAKIMEEVGQLQIAWNAYERAIELQDAFWPVSTVREKMVQICRSRQEKIANAETAIDPTGWQATMRKNHVDELAWGQAYQNAYHDFESAQIARGLKLDDPNFYTDFYRNRPAIASDPGLVDDVLVTHRKARSMLDSLPCTVLGAGIGMLVGVCSRRA